MARSVTEIKKEITDNFVANEAVQQSYSLDNTKTFEQQFSVASIESIFFYVVAMAVWVLEVLFDRHRDEVETLLSNRHAHTLNYYTEKALQFLYGFQLVPFTCEYDTTGKTDSEIAAAKIVTYAATARYKRDNGRVFLRVKAAKGTTERQPLDAAELQAFTRYVQDTQDAGVDLECTSNNPDRVRQTWTVYYDPQVLDADGNRLDGSAQDVVKSAIVDYMQSLPFNGLYVPTFHVDALQKVSGVRVPLIDENKVSEDNGGTWKTPPAEGVIPNAGWYKFYDDALIINMKPYQYGENV